MISQASRSLDGVMGIVQTGFWWMMCTTVVRGVNILVKCETSLLNKFVFLLWDSKRGGFTWSVYLIIQDKI